MLRTMRPLVLGLSPTARTNLVGSGYFTKPGASGPPPAMSGLMSSTGLYLGTTAAMALALTADPRPPTRLPQPGELVAARADPALVPSRWRNCRRLVPASRALMAFRCPASGPRRAGNVIDRNLHHKRVEIASAQAQRHAPRPAVSLAE